MLAPRRVGKTSLMLELRRKPLENWHVVYVDVEGAVDPADWVAAVISELAKSPTYRTWLERLPFKESLSEVWGALNKAEIDFPMFRVELKSAMGNVWPVEIDRLYARLSQLPEANSRLLIISDELPVLLSRMLRDENGRDEVELFLAKLRSWRQSPQLRGKVHLLLGGSIGLDSLLRRYNLSAMINDLASFQVSSWDRETAVAFLQWLAQDNHFPLDDDHIALILDLLNDPVPYHVQLYFHELLEALEGNAAALTTNRVKECFDTRLVGPGGTPHLDHYLNRLELSLDVDSYKAAKNILHSASRRRVLAIKNIETVAGQQFGLYQTVLIELERDGYIRRNGKTIEIRSNLLRAWLRKNLAGESS